MPGRGVFWCPGPCGLKEICAEHTFNEGYCLEPKDRIKAVKLGMKPFIRTDINNE